MQTRWLKILNKEINSTRQICILGVGNSQKGDDGVGPLIIKKLRFEINKKKFNDILLIDGGEAPENFSGEIRRFQPGLTIIIDACAGGRKPGTIYIVNPDKIQYDDISTHKLPLSMLVKFLEDTIPTKVIIIGIEPKNCNFQEAISQEVDKSIEKLISTIILLLSNWKKTIPQTPQRAP
uniref:Hydrogenase maturation peptidase HycI n=1 Tax=candidate division WOR-3 bacterium TaxID=2052148 RepID=A0A7C6EGB2_UNCW3